MLRIQYATNIRRIYSEINKNKILIISETTTFQNNIKKDFLF